MYRIFLSMNDYEETMGKVIRIGGRGTSRRVAEKESDNWTGTAFKDYANAKKEAAKDQFVTVGRGTTKVKFGDLPSSSSGPSHKGLWVRTGRGTGKRRLD